MVSSNSDSDLNPETPIGQKSKFAQQARAALIPTMRGKLELTYGKIVTHYAPRMTPYLYNSPEHYEKRLNELTYTVISPMVKAFRVTRARVDATRTMMDRARVEVEIEDFLRNHIWSFKNQSKLGRQQLVQAFNVESYCAGVTLIREGEPNTNAMFIMEGECRINKKS